MEKVLQAYITQKYGITQTVATSRPDPKFGDSATNVALQLAKPTGKNPRVIAEELAQHLRETGNYSEVSIAGPGFINIRLSDDTLWKQAQARNLIDWSGQSLVFEYSCPNAFKELHTGHLYQTIFGDNMARLLERTGVDMHRTSFGGDVGLHVAKSMHGIIAFLGGEHPQKLQEVSSDAMERAAWVSARYVEGARAYEDSEDDKQAIIELNKKVYQLHKSGDQDSDFAQLYYTVRQWSFEYFDAFYDAVQVRRIPRYYPESETVAPGMAVVDAQLARGVLEQSDGAIVFKGDETKHLHTRVFVNSAGLPTYETKDTGVIALEKQEYDFDKRILITGNDQKEYMRVVFAANEQFDPELQGKMTHITNGTVKFADGKKMSSRLGNVARGIDVVTAVRQRVTELVDNTDVIEDVTMGAIKYAFCRYKLGGDIAFNIDETVSLQGNSGPYLQYAHARVSAIIAKSDQTPQYAGILDQHERELVVKLGEYTDILNDAINELSLHGLCGYLYELAQTFNRFYEHAQIVGHEREAHRLAIAHQYRHVLADGLELLGIAAIEKM